MAAGYPAGARFVQGLVGVTERAERNARALRGDIPEVAARFLAAQPQVMTSWVDRDQRVWASLLVGSPGFVHAPDDRHVVIRAEPSPGDPLEGLRDGDPLGVLGIEPETRRRMRVNGPVRRTDDGALLVTADRVVSNCTKYIAKRRHHVDPGALRPVRSEWRSRLTEAQQRWLATTDTFLLATAAEGVADISHRGGEPGFVTVVDDRHLTWPDYVGNAMFLTLGNIHQNPRAGLLVVDWERGSTLQLTGTARVELDIDDEARSRHPGAERLVHFELEQVSEVSGASPLRWELEERSPANPPVPERPVEAPLTPSHTQGGPT